jgi:hypothetical protein
MSTNQRYLKFYFFLDQASLRPALGGGRLPAIVSRNNLSYADKHRDAALAERLFWAVLEHLQSPGFGTGGRGKGLVRRFWRVIHVVDSSTIALIASCIDWAQHRRRKAAAKLHVRPDLHMLALVEVDGQEREMEFLTNKLSWSAGSVADLNRCRWQIEVFFKQIKQGLQLCDFLGNSANAVRWQIWTAMVLYVLMRFLCLMCSWNHSFTRLLTLLRAALWRKIDLCDLLKFCGTAGDISGISLLPRARISRDLPSQIVGQHQTTLKKFFLFNQDNS